MKSITLILLSLVLSLGLHAQKLLKTEDVPTTVQKRFDKKFRNAKKIKWFKENKFDYLVKFEMSDYKGEAHLDKEGVITKSKLEMDPERLPSRVHQYLKENYKRMRLNKAFSATEGRKDQYFIVFMHQSQGRKKPPLVYEIQFDRSGRFITEFAPEIKDEPIKEEEDDFLEDVDKEDKVEVEEEMEIRRSDLPSAIIAYLKDNYNYEYKEKEILLKTTKKYGQIYYVVMKKQGEKVKYVHYFDLDGKLIKKVEKPVRR